MSKIRSILVSLVVLLSFTAFAQGTETPEAIEVFYESFRTGDTAPVVAVLAEDWAAYPPNPGQVPGIEGLNAVLGGYRAVFPDLDVRTDAVYVSGDYVTVRSTFTGTQEVDFLGVPATGKPVEFRAVDIHHIVDGKITETWHLEDLFGVTVQLTAQ
jgi:steroid delta-isomerase-like uncharacterized protein